MRADDKLSRPDRQKHRKPPRRIGCQGARTRRSRPRFRRPAYTDRQPYTSALLLRRGGFALVLWAIAANLLPVAAVLGLVGWAGIGIDPVNAMLGAILLVMVVDDTIHMTLRYRRERAEECSVREALARCFPTVGEAILSSSLCLLLECYVMLTAQWGGLVFFGLLASVGAILALVGDLLLLPAGLIVSAGSVSQDG